MPSISRPAEVCTDECFHFPWRRPGPLHTVNVIGLLVSCLASPFTDIQILVHFHTLIVYNHVYVSTVLCFNKCSVCLA